jgi:diguanylate cyclase (GGDEF)-like protein
MNLLWDILQNNRKNKDTEYYLNMSSRQHPYLEAGLFALLYLILGITWLAFPDSILAWLFHITTDFRIINIMKGWTFVVLSALLIFIFLLRRLLLFDGALKKLDINRKQQKLIEQELNQMAYYDALTKLPNRSLLENKCRELIQSSPAGFAFICMDVDNFKNINDSLGHSAGDQFLVSLSERLKKCVGPRDFAARVGGDEFVILLTSIKTREEIEKQLQRLQNSLKRPWIFRGLKFITSISMGVALYPEHGRDLQLLHRNSDIAMYAVKKNAKNNFCFYSEELNRKNLHDILMIHELHKAIENEEFLLYYQPIFNLETGKISGVEALIRWLHPEQGLISPMEFIPLAEESGLIHDIEDWIIRTAFRQKKEWEQSFSEGAGLFMSINISGKSFVRYGFVNMIRNLLMQTGLNSNEILFEITETVLIEKMDISKKVINDISNMGVQIALDDFGSGYSSLTYLKNLPIDVVKLDANFIRGIIAHGEDRLIVEAITALTHSLGLRIVAEGIETKEQLAILEENNCDYGQGYLFGRPVPGEVLETILKEKREQICIEEG